MEWTIRWGGDPEDVALVTEGRVTVEELDDAIQAMLGAPEFHEGMRVLLDHRKADWSGMQLADIHRRVALIRRDAEQIGRQRVAFVAPNQIGFGLARMIEAFVESHVAYAVRVFSDVDEARAWLAAG